MPRYFFDLNDGAEWPDDEGVVLPNLETARLEARCVFTEPFSGMIRKVSRGWMPGTSISGPRARVCWAGFP